MLLNSEGVSKLQPKGFYPGYQKEKRAQTLKALAKPRSRSWPTLSAFAGSVDGVSQGVATLYPGLALINAFGVPVFRRSSFCAKPCVLEVFNRVVEILKTLTKDG